MEKYEITGAEITWSPRKLLTAFNRVAMINMWDEEKEKKLSEQSFMKDIIAFAIDYLLAKMRTRKIDVRALNANFIRLTKKRMFITKKKNVQIHQIFFFVVECYDEHHKINIKVSTESPREDRVVVFGRTQRKKRRCLAF